MHRTWTPFRPLASTINSEARAPRSSTDSAGSLENFAIFPHSYKLDNSEGLSAMAPGMAIAPPAFGKSGFGLWPRQPAAVAELGVEELRRRNEELEREVRERAAREEEMREELERTRSRLRVAEEAEERLCVELGEIEAEAVAQARDYYRRIKALSDELDEARRILGSSSSSSSSSAGESR